MKYQRPATRRLTRVAGVILFAFLLQSSASADAGLPMIAVVFPGMIGAFIPIVVIESYVLRRALKLGVKEAVYTATLGNVVSTLIGVPLTWAVLVGIEIVLDLGGVQIGGTRSPVETFFTMTLGAPWLGVPIGGDPQMYWKIPLASLYLLVPFFFASWAIEYFVARSILNGVSAVSIKRAVRDANIWSYALLAVIVLVLLAYRIATHKG